MNSFYREFPYKRVRYNAISLYVIVHLSDLSGCFFVNSIRVKKLVKKRQNSRLRCARFWPFFFVQFCPLEKQNKSIKTTCSVLDFSSMTA